MGWPSRASIATARLHGAQGRLADMNDQSVCRRPAQHEVLLRIRLYAGTSRQHRLYGLVPRGINVLGERAYRYLNFEWRVSSSNQLVAQLERHYVAIACR